MVVVIKTIIDAKISYSFEKPAKTLLGIENGDDRGKIEAIWLSFELVSLKVKKDK